MGSSASQGAVRPYMAIRQQALSDLQQACSGDGRQALADLQAHAVAAGASVFDPSPEELIRQDRAR